MKKTLKDDEVLHKVTHIIGASGHADDYIQVAETLLDVFDRTTNHQYVVEQIIAHFDPKKIERTYKYKFPPSWHPTRIGPVFKECIREFIRYTKAIIEVSNGSLKDAAKMIVGTLERLDGDERTVFFMSVLKEELCPYNFYTGQEKLTLNEINEIASVSPTIKKLCDMFNGDGDQRFLTLGAKGDYIASCLEGLPRRELIVAIVMMMDWSHQQGANESKHKQIDIMGSMGDLMEHMEEMGLPLFPFGFGDSNHEGEGLHSALGFTNPLEAMLRNTIFGGNARIDLMRANQIFDRAFPNKGGCKDPNCPCGGSSC